MTAGLSAWIVAAGAAIAAPAPLATLPGTPRALDPIHGVLIDDARPAETTHAHACFADPGSPMARAIAAVAGRSPAPALARARILHALTVSPACYAPDLTQEQWERIIDDTGLLPAGIGVENWPSQAGLNTRFAVDTQVWTGDIALGTRGQAKRARLTYSFPPDGITWGLSATGYPTGPNDLSARLTTLFGAADLDRGREIIRQAIACWRRFGGLSYQEVGDDGAVMDTIVTRQATRGDIRIGAVAMGTATGILAYNAFPSAAGVSSIRGGDMCINSSYFTPSILAWPAADYRYLRNTVAHEHGHGLGFIHVIPCNQTKLMEPAISTNFNMLTVEEVRALGNAYGDRYSGNGSGATAIDLGNMTSPVQRSFIARDLSTNGPSFPAPPDLPPGEDWFKVTFSSTQPMTITVDPTGGQYATAQQSSGCTGSGTSIDADRAGDLYIEIRDLSFNLLATTDAGPGVTEVLTRTMTAGSYFVRVRDHGPNPAANQIVQMYDLTIRVGASPQPAPPYPIAGINKRCQADTNCWFMGAINSRAMEDGATIPADGYAWDLDGNGSFETPGATVSTQFRSNGVHTVTLRVTDSNGMTATDTITATVFGATTAIDNAVPDAVVRNTTTPITITGRNFKGVTSSSQVTVSGSGVTVTGVPTVNHLGTQITGLSLVVTSSAATGQRNLTVTNSDGLGATATANALINIVTAVPANDGCLTPGSWGATAGVKPFTNLNASTSFNQNFTASGCPADGPLANDVWYAWSAPASGVLSIAPDAGVTFSTRIAAYAGSLCPGTTSPALACDDFGAALTFPVTAGANYLFQVGSAVRHITGSGSIVLTLTLPTGACCAADGTCSVLSPSACTAAGGSYRGDGAACSPGLCPAPLIACCFLDGSCLDITAAQCGSLGGAAGAPGSSCSINSCAVTQGACCAGTGCSIVLSAAACTGVGGVFQGAASTCGSPDNPTTCCRANIDALNGVDADDIFAYLNLWFSLKGTSAPAADIDGSGSVDADDIFTFIDLWFQGC